MREREMKVLEKAIKTVTIMIESEIEEEDVNTKFCMMYLEDTINDLIGYASTIYRIEEMNTKDLFEFINSVIEFEKLMYDIINNASI